jgi:hypothetical protein
MRRVDSGLSSVSPDDYARGVRGYTANTYTCVCGKPASAKWFNARLMREVVACSQECANNVRRKP